jgi:hypothetical protein
MEVLKMNKVCKNKKLLGLFSIVFIVSIVTSVLLLQSSVFGATTATKVKGSEVLLIGESFIAMSHDITKYLQEDARNAGVLASNDSFRDKSVSGTKLSGGISPSIPDQYKNAVKEGAVKYVVMDGGGNDCLQSSGSSFTSNSPEVVAATGALKNLLTQMNKDGVKKVVYFFYPEPQSALGGLKGKLDVLRPLVQNIVTSTAAPKCYWLDTRPVFQGNYSKYVLSDGIHPTAAGSKATADAIWNVIQSNGVFN